MIPQPGPSRIAGCLLVKMNFKASGGAVVPRERGSAKACSRMSVVAVYQREVLLSDIRDRFRRRAVSTRFGQQVDRTLQRFETQQLHAYFSCHHLRKQ